MVARVAPPLPERNTYGKEWRVYEQNAQTEAASRVERFYKEQHEHQTLAYVQEMKEKYSRLNTLEMGVWEAAELLNSIVDESDPDLDLPQIQHLLQTAESCRRAHPDKEWFALAGFVHDLGKVLAHPAFGSQPQWAVVGAPGTGTRLTHLRRIQGDTFPVGCAFDPSIVYHNFFAANPDSRNPELSTPMGIYEPQCGLDKVHMSWGHDEYMAMVMTANGCTLPPAALAIVRYHSCYAIHREKAYSHLLAEGDQELLEWVREFNKHDLYSKSIEQCDVEALKPYYQGLIKKFFPAKLRW